MQLMIINQNLVATKDIQVDLKSLDKIYINKLKNANREDKEKNVNNTLQTIYKGIPYCTKIEFSLRYKAILNYAIS